MYVTRPLTDFVFKRSPFYAIKNRLKLSVNSRKGIMKMFKNERCVTAKIRDEVQPELIAFLWSWLDNLVENGEKVGCLQIFTLMPCRKAQQINHNQQDPLNMNVLLVAGVKTPITAEIYIIDDGTCSTMLFADEY